MFIALIVPHGIFEIPALIFESAAGVLLFLFIWRFLKTIDTTRNDVSGFKLRAKNSWKLNRIYLKQSIVLRVFSCFLLIVAAKPPTTESIQSPREFTGVVRLLLIDPARPFTALTTTFTFFLIPLASSFIKSGIYSSASDSGPSSGTEKCMTERILSATPLMALVTSPIFD